jgi:hypothetical protein
MRSLGLASGVWLALVVAFAVASAYALAGPAKPFYFDAGAY